MTENCAVPQQHKPGGQILQKQITEDPHLLPERDIRYKVLSNNKIVSPFWAHTLTLL